MEPVIELIKCKTEAGHKVQVVVKVAEFEHDAEAVVDEAAEQFVHTLHKLNGHWHRIWEN